jgi:hypothetical protein
MRMSPTDLPRVVHPGHYYKNAPKYVGIELVWNRFPGWRFVLDVAIDRPEVIAVQVRPANEDDWPRGGLQTSKPPLDRLPLEALTKVARRSMARSLRRMEPGTYSGFVLEDGRAVPVTVDLGEADTARLRDMGRGVGNRIGSAGRSNAQRLSNRDVAAYLHDYLVAVGSGKSVSEFLQRKRSTSTELENRKKQGESRGLYVRGHQRPRPAGRLTQAGERALKEK